MVRVCYSYSLGKPLLLFVMLLCLTSLAEGSCWRYGHACWGGHGKRSGSLRIATAKNEERPLTVKPDSLLLRVLGVSRDPQLNTESDEHNEVDGLEGKDVTIVLDYDQTDPPKTDDEEISLVAKRSEVGSDYMSDSDGSGEEVWSRHHHRQELNSLPQFSDAMNSWKGNLILYKRDSPRQQNLKHVRKLLIKSG